MTKTFSARIDHGLTGTQAVCELSGIPSSAVGHQATLSLRTRVDVKRSSGVDANTTLFEHKLKLQSTSLRVPLPIDVASWYHYDGKQIDIRVIAHLEVDDGIVFDTKLETEPDLPRRQTSATQAKTSGTLIEPTDRYSLQANLRALAPRDRMIVKALLLIGSVVGLGNAAVGVHDEFSSESQIIFYDHQGSDGSESPTMKSLFGSGGVGLTLWLVVRARLRRYMRIALRPNVTTPRRGERVRARDLVEGEARVPLDGSTLRVVAANRENGQYREKSGKETKTRNFTDPVQAIVLFEQFLPHIPAGEPLGDHLDGDVDFDPIFTVLMPPQMSGGSHGIDVVWEVQLLHPEFVDQELQGPTDWQAADWHPVSHSDMQT